MKLCIADPPYLGRGVRLYGAGSGNSPFAKRERARAKSPAGYQVGDNHPDAHLWDDPETHRQMVERLCDEYDGWAIAMAWDNLRHYLQWTPPDVWIGVWVKPDSPPSASRIHNPWEPVVILPAAGRRAHGKGESPIRGVLNAGTQKHFVGAKPPAWTRWVLDLLGYDPDTDTVDDLFHGSGAVAAEIAQGVLNLNDMKGA